MAIVRVDFSTSQPSEFASSVSVVIDSTMQNTLGVPPKENYIVCHGHPSGAILYDPENCSADRLERIVFIQITINQGRSVELKAQFLNELNRNLVRTGYLKAENIFINIVEVARENWSFGIGNV